MIYFTIVTYIYNTKKYKKNTRKNNYMTTELKEVKEIAVSNNNNNNNIIPPIVHLIWHGIDAPSPVDHPNKKI